MAILAVSVLSSIFVYQHQFLDNVKPALSVGIPFAYLDQLFDVEEDAGQLVRREKTRH